MQILLTFILLIIVGTVCSIFAKQRGRDPVAWYMLGMLFGLFALFFLFLLPAIPPQGNEPLDGVEENEDLRLARIDPILDYPKKEWFYFDDTRKQQGPVRFEILKTLWEEGKVTRQSYVWSEGMTEWEKIDKLRGFEDALEMDADPVA